MRKFFYLLTFILVLGLTACASNSAQNVKPTGSKNAETSAGASNGQSAKTSYPDIAVYSYDGGAKKAYRMFPYYWLTDEAFEATCEGLLKYGDCIDEVTLFCDNMHAPYMTEDDLKKYSSVLKGRIAKLRELGFSSVGINMLQTIGHGDYGTGWLATAPFQTAVDYQGKSSVNQLCPRTEKFKEYIKHKYQVFAQTGPDFIWVDDDFRVPDKTVDYTCFCAGCVSKFNKQYGTSYTREKLVDALSSSDEEGQKLRKEWSEFNLNAYSDVMGYISEAVAGVNPDIKMGLMTVHLQANEYNLSDYRGMAKALGADMLRPGGGFHTEKDPQECLIKIFGVTHQVADLANISDRQYELEDFPQTSYKSAKMHMVECTASLMAGCNGIAFASVPPDTGNDDVMTAVRNHQKLWDTMVKVADGWKLYGGTAVYDKEYAIYCDDSHYFNKTAHYYQNDEMTPFEFGFMPYTPYMKNSVVGVLSKDIAAALSDEDLRELFSKGVMLDGGAAKILIDRGYGSLIGSTRTSYMITSMEERYQKHDLNGSASGTLRYTYGNDIYTFTLMDGAEALSAAESVTGAQTGVSSYIYKNELGGRVVVYGYMPWEYYDTWQRLEQTKNIVDWLSDGKLPVKVVNDDNIVSLIKQPDDRSKFMLMLINAYIDDTVDELEVRILGEFKGDLMYCDEDGNSAKLDAEKVKVENGYTTLKLPKMTGWGFSVIYTA